MSAATRTNLIAVILAFAGFALISFALLNQALAHGGHPQKKLFENRWYQTVQAGDYDQWMTLSTNEFMIVDCLDPAACESRWLGPANGALTDWNSANTTIRVENLPGFNEFYDLHLVIQDFALGDLFLSGIALPYNNQYELCVDCEIWYGVVVIGDFIHLGPWGTNAVRQSTVSHEFGHLFGLRHESTNGDENEHYGCGQDDTGPIPPSIMSYNCIDPVSEGGMGIYEVQDWDVCGVNHAYHDPTIGYAGCGTESIPTPTATPTSTPTPTATATSTATASPTPTTSPEPTPEGLRHGDLVCAGTPDLDSVFALLQYVAQLSSANIPGCPIDFGDDVAGYAWGDVNCDAFIDFVDVLWILLYLGVGLTPDPPVGCPAVLDEIQL